MRTAVRYYGAFPEEIDRRISLNTEDADEAEAAWKREQAEFSKPLSEVNTMVPGSQDEVDDMDTDKAWARASNALST